MTQLNGVSPFTNNPAADPSIVASANTSVSGSFQSQLSAAIAATLEKFGIDPNKVASSIASIVSGIPAARQNAASASSVTPPPQSLPDDTLASHDPILSFDDAYWAKQPAAVQALRNIDDPSKRSVLAGQLAAAGYKIDAPVMVWGWDPAKVASLRQGLGYSWVPASFQPQVAEAPGVDDHGSQPYDPANPPVGSIAV